MQSLAQKNIVITGASSGIGKEMALRLAKEQARLVLLARSVEKLEEVADQVRRLGAEAWIAPCDISSQGDVEMVFGKIYEHVGSIDILMNNAGVWDGQSAEHCSAQELEKLFSINTFGVFYCTAQVIPAMKKNTSGEVLTIVSRAALSSRKDYPFYASSKAAVKSYLESLDDALAGTGVKVMGLYPGLTETGLFRNHTEQKTKFAFESMSAKDVADAAVWMLMQPSLTVLNHVEIRPLEQRG